MWDIQSLVGANEQRLIVKTFLYHALFLQLLLCTQSISSSHTQAHAKINLQLLSLCPHFMQQYHFYCHPLMGICWGLFLNELPVQDYIMMGLDVTAGWRWDYKKAKWTGAGYTSCLLNRGLHQIFSVTDSHRSAVQLLWMLWVQLSSFDPKCVRMAEQKCTARRIFPHFI